MVHSLSMRIVYSMTKNKLWRGACTIRLSNTDHIQCDEHIRFKERRSSFRVTRIKRINVPESETVRGAWPTETHEPCDSCRHTFTTFPIGVPRRICCTDAKSTTWNLDNGGHITISGQQTFPHGFVFYLEGLFCGFGCMIRHAKLHRKYNYALIKTLYSQLTGRDSCDLLEAPPIAMLRKFGGKTPIEEYRRLSQTGTVLNQLIYPLLRIQSWKGEVVDEVRSPIFEQRDHPSIKSQLTQPKRFTLSNFLQNDAIVA